MINILLHRGFLNLGDRQFQSAPTLLFIPALLAAAIILVSAGFAVAGTVRYVDVNSPSPAYPYSSWDTAAATIQDAVEAAVAGDEVLVTNGVYETGGSVAFGTLTNRVAVTRPIALRSVNGPLVTIIKGYHVPGTTNGESAVRCVYLANGATLSGFTLKEGATQSGYTDHDGGGVCCESSNVFVSDCILSENSALYGGGAYRGTMSNCTFNANWALPSSAGQFGGVGAGSCDSVLFNCLLVTNIAAYSGGGAQAGSLVNCRLLSNKAANGGGAAGSRMQNCVLAGNAAFGGGGACGGTLVDCIVTNNSAINGGGVDGGNSVNCLIAYNWATDSGGGASSASLYNCTVVYNAATNTGGGGWGWGSTIRGNAWCYVYNCIVASNVAALLPDCACTQYDSCIPTPSRLQAGSGNISAPPQFVNAGSGDFRLASTSPCINAGNSLWVRTPELTNRFDLDGNPRATGGAVDLGAYEVQEPTSAISFAWLSYYHFSIDGSADSADPDGDGMNNFQEWRAATDATNSASVLELLPLVRIGTNALLRWEGVDGRPYFLERGTNLLAPFCTISTQVFTNVSGHLTALFLDTNAPVESPAFYRLRVGQEITP